jgi:hypothetical protein
LSDRAVDHIEACLSFVQPQLVVGQLGVVAEIRCAPLDVEDTIRRSAGHRGVNAAGTAGVSRAAGHCIGAQVVPIRQDSVVVRDPWQANAGKGDIRGRKLGIAVGRHIDAGERLVIQGVTEWYRDTGYHVVSVIAGVRGARHDTATYLCDLVMVLGRATLHCVIPREGRIAIACESSDGPGANARRHAASEIEMHCESHCHASVDQAVTGHSAASIAGQGQVAVLD